LVVYFSVAIVVLTVTDLSRDLPTLATRVLDPFINLTITIIVAAVAYFG
jgi:hypothetical protein